MCEPSSTDHSSRLPSDVTFPMSAFTSNEPLNTASRLAENCMETVGFSPSLRRMRCVRCR